MTYEVIYKDKAQKDIAFHKRSGNKPLSAKLLKLLDELRLHPRTGTGKPERLKYKANETWSRRINDEHRLVYSIDEKVITVEVISAKGHYE